MWSQEVHSPNNRRNQPNQEKVRSTIQRNQIPTPWSDIQLTLMR